MKDIKKYIKAKKRKKLIKKLTLITTIIVVALFIFFTRAPIFNIKSIVFKGNVTISTETLFNEIKDRIGLNIFTVNQKSIKTEILNNRYVSSVKIRRKGLNKLQIEITEEAPVYYIYNGNKLLIINNDLDVLEEVDSIEGRHLVEVKGIDINELNSDDKAETINSYKKILLNFYPYISKNKEEIYLTSLDISNIIDIIGYVGDVKILFGDDSDLYNKMENVYRILLDENINIVKGYINVSFNGSPIIKKEEVEDVNTSDIEEVENIGDYND